jgi:hypothetical protein
MNRPSKALQSFVLASEQSPAAVKQRARVQTYYAIRAKIRQIVDYAFMPVCCLLIIAAIWLTGGKP